MKKKIITQLALSSYKGSTLDEKKINKISSLLSRSDLKKFISALKNLENNKNLIISSPFDNHYYKDFEKIFPNKTIIFKKDPSLLLGIRIVDNDIIYEFTLKNTLDKIVSFLEKNYD